MFQIYLPIAEMSVNIWLLVGMGLGVGFLSGLFGVGGGFLMTPLLIFMGVSPAIAVGTQNNQIVAASISGMMAHWRRKNVDLKLGMVLLVGGAIGSAFGAWLFKLLVALGQIDLVISLLYVVFLGIVGGLMLVESLRAAWRSRQLKGRPPPRPKPRHDERSILDALPFKMRFKRSKLYISVLTPLMIGALVGILAAIMGVGGGFIMLPLMIYVLKMPTSLVVGTSLFQIAFVAAIGTVLHSVNNFAVDAILALILLIGAVIGAQIGTRFGTKLPAEQLRILLAVMVLGVCLRLLFDLVLQPEELFTIQIMRTLN